MDKQAKLNDFSMLNQQYSEIVLEIEQFQNEIISISERIQTLEATPNHLIDKTSKEFKDQVTKARDKRIRIRETIAELNHTARLKLAEIKAVEMEFCNAT